MDLWVILLSIFICCLALFLWRTMTFFKDSNLPHESPFPIIGNMLSVFLRREHLVDLVTRYYRRWPDAKYFGFYDFITPVIVIRDPEIIKSIGVKNFDNFPDHRNFVNEDSDPLFGKSLFGLKGDRWKEVRSLLSPAFTASKLRQMSELMAICAKDFADVVEKSAKEGNEDMEIKNAFTKYTNDVIATCAFGIQVNSMKEPNNEFYVNATESVNFQGWRTVKLLFTRFAPGLAKMLKVRVFDTDVVNFFTDIVKTTVETREKNGITRPDMIQLMMETKGKGVQLDLQDMTAQAFIFFFAGLDVSSSLMTFAAISMALDQKVQDRLLEEVDEVIRQSNGKPTFEQITGMAYMEAILYETLRLYPLGGFVDRLCKKSFELPPAVPGGQSYTVQPGMNIWFPLSGIHTDPLYYEEPMKFNPDRFLNQKITINTPTFLAFGIGPRACIGNRFALMETKLLLFHLLMKCKFEMSPKLQLPITYSKTSLLVLVEGGAWVRVVPRK